MGKGEGDTTNKTPKSSPAQEAPPSSPAAVYPDWASVQAYYNAAGTPVTPSGFYPSPVASSQGHPYMWGPQIIPPYGTAPPPYVTMYPGGGIYPHPSIPPGSHPYSPYPMIPPNGTTDASVAGAGGADVDGKSNGMGKASVASANGVFSQSAESGSEGSSEGSDANSDNGLQQKQNREHGKGDEVQNGSTSGSANGLTQMPTPLMPIPAGAITSPTTTLNIGMDYWGGPNASTVTPLRSKLPVKHTAATDERELKRQRRKQSNRESARRSRLRKQAECEELAQRVGTLKQENDTLKEELDHIREECKKLASANASLTERLQGKQEEQSKADKGSTQPDSNA